MAARKLSQEQREAFRAEISRMDAMGMTQQEIAAKTGATQQMVSYHLQAINEAYKASIVEYRKIAQGKELAKLNLVECESWKAWDESCTGERKAATNSAAKRGKRSQEKDATPQPGDAKYLDMVLKCSDRRRKLLGLDSPPTLMQEEREDTELEKLTEEDLRALLKDDLASMTRRLPRNQQTTTSGEVQDSEDIHADTAFDPISTTKSEYEDGELNN